MTLPCHRLVLTPGEPSSIGPDLCIFQSQHIQPCEIITIADPNLLETRARELGIAVNIHEFNAGQPAAIHPTGQLNVLPLEMSVPAQCGKLNKQNAQYVLRTIKLAAEGCLSGTYQAMITGPVHKGILNDAGIPFSGHTEYIAAITGGLPVMMLATPGLRVALLTTHLPLRAVSQAITRERLTGTIGLLHQDLQVKFGIENPRILVCGLNPHAGEGGHLGHEEIEIIEPVLAGFRRQGMQIQGPLPADTLFTAKYLETADAVLAMYHDQGLPVLKYRGFGQAVNITLGLPIIRTSVDHGTALGLAGTGKADCGSLLYAIKTALEMTAYSSL